MISLALLNTIIKPKRYLMTVELMIKTKLNENLIDIIMNHTNFIRIPKEKLDNVFGLIALLTNRIYRMYNNELNDWMNYYGNNDFQIIKWKRCKIDLNKLNDLYYIVIYLLKSHFNLNLNFTIEMITNNLIINVDNNNNSNCFNINMNNSIFKIAKI